jgi:transcriptional regulator with XRE-family HTH domain
MTLSEFLKSYRENHELSMDDFAKLCGLSKPYISMLEKNRNSRGGKAITPSIRTYEKIAHAAGLSVDELMRTLSGDEMVSLAIPEPITLTSDEETLVTNYRKLSPAGKEYVRDQVDFRLKKEAAKVKESMEIA